MAGGAGGHTVRTIRLAMFVACALCIATPAAVAQEEDVATRLDRVVLQLKWRHQFQFAGYYVAIERGYYRELGLEVEIVEAEPGLEPMDAVVEGRADFGVGTTDLLLMRDAGIPVVVLANIFQHSPLALMTLHDGGIRNIHELARGRLMIEPHSAELFAYLTDEGIALERLDLVPHDFDTRNLVSGRVDAMSVYSTDEPWDLKSQGVPYLLFRPIESGIDFYGDNLFTLQSRIDRHPEQVRRFVEASVRGWQYAMANPEETAALIVTRYDTVKSLPHLLFEAEGMQPLVNAGIVEVGYVNPGRWARIAEKYGALGMIDPDLDLAGFFYDAHSRADYGAYYRLIAVLAAIAAALAVLVLWYRRMNERLQREVAERKEAQAELALLLSIIGHDLRAPFNVLLNYGEMLVAQGAAMDAARLAGIFRNVRDAAAAAYTLLNNLLEWAALQTERTHAVPETVPAAELIDRVCDLLRPQAGAKGVALAIDAAPGVMLHADPRMIETVLRNVIGNALKYSQPGAAVSITVRGRGEETVIDVADRGIGIAPERLERLFAFEARRPVPGTSRESGSGIGLILSRDLVVANGGRLEVASTLDVGTTVTLLLPAGAPVRQAALAVSRAAR